jgi:transcriptional regulator with XRE-family HTH domain
VSTASSFGELVAIARRRAKISQRDLAQLVAVHPITVSNWERGEKEPDQTTKRRVADALLNSQPVNDDVTATLEQIALGSAVRRFQVRESEDDDRFYLSRELRTLATEFELEALKTGANNDEISYVRQALQGADAGKLFSMVYANQHGLSFEIIEADYKTLIASLRDFLAARIHRRERVTKVERPDVPAARPSDRTDVSEDVSRKRA